MLTKPLPWLLTLTLMFGCSTRSHTNTPNYPTEPIELKYYKSGSWAVTTKLAGACCDSLQNKFDLYYPTNLGANGFKHPILTFGNGTDAPPGVYSYFLTHLASWGFVIVVTEDRNTGPGQTILDAANYMIAANSDSSSVFYQKLNVTEVGAMGHSQGAVGAINALIKSGGSIKTVVPIEMPPRMFCSSEINCADTSGLVTGSVFFIDASGDGISPATQSWWEHGEQSIAAYYKATPDNVQKLKATLIGPDHLDLLGRPSCAAASFRFICNYGVYGYLGYPTAWMMAELQGDAYAARAFTRGSGEIFSETTNWEYVDSNIP